MANEFKVKKGLIVDGSGTVLDVQGTEGQLFSITDSLTGDLFSVSDVSGVPILNIDSSGEITLDGHIAYGNKLNFGTSGNGLEIYADSASNSYIKETGGSGALVFQSNHYYFQDNSNNTRVDINAANGNTIVAGNLTVQGATTSLENNVIVGNSSADYLEARYNNTANYATRLMWKGVQFGNNGVNKIIAGRTGANGYFDFYVNNTNDGLASTPDGYLALTLSQNKDAAFKGNVTVYTGASTGALSVGRNSSERLEIHQGDTNTTVTAYNDIDENQEHNFILDRSFGGSGGNNFLIRKGGVAQLSIDKDAKATFAGNVVVNGSLIGKSDHTTELGSYADGQIKRIRMSQGGEVVLGDSSTANPIGLTEGVWNSFGDSDYVSIYSRNSFRVFGYGTSATPQTHMFVGRHTSSGGSFLGVGNITAPNGTHGTNDTVLTVKGTTSAGEGIIQAVGLGNTTGDIVGRLSFHSYAEADAMASIRSIRGNADDKGTLAFSTNNGGTETTKMTILPTGEIGIGTTTPLDFDGESRNLVIRGGVNGTNPTIGITIAGNGNQAATGRGAIRFADGITGDERYRGGIEYNHNGDVMSFRTSAVQRVSIGANNSTDGTMMIQAHDNSWNGGLYLKSSNGNVTAKLHPENSGNYGLMLSSNFYVAGNVGLGTEPGAARLEVAGGSLSTNTVTNLGISTALTDGRTRTYDSNSLASVSVRGDASSLELAAGSSSGYYSGIGLTARGATAASGTIIGYTYGVQRFRVDADGDFGINTTNPTAKFHVYGTTKLTGGTLQVSTDTSLTSNYSYTFRDAVGINNPNSLSAATSSTTTMAIGSKSGGTVNTSLITTAAVGVATADPASVLHVHGTQSYGTIRVSPTSANGESAMAFFLDTAGTTTGTAWVVGHAGWGNTGDFVIGNQQYGGPIMLIQQDGKTGIGTTAPVTTLDVRGNGSTSLAATSGTTVGTGTRFRIASSTNASAVLDFGIGSSSRPWIQSTDRTDLSAANRLLLNPNGGNVGIGSTTPSYRLQVYDAVSDAPLMLESGDGFVGIKFKDPDADDNLYYRGDTESFYFTGNRLGVGTSNPTRQLSVYQGDSGHSYAHFINTTTGSNAGDGVVVGISDSEEGILWNHENTAMKLATNNSVVLTLDTSLNVSFANVALFNDNKGINFGNSNAKIYGSSADGIKFNASGSEAMRLNQSGKLTLDPGTLISAGGTVLDIQGSEGQLFSITNSLSGDLFSVADVSGVPILNVNSSGLVEIDDTLDVQGNVSLGGGVLQTYHSNVTSVLAMDEQTSLFTRADQLFIANNCYYNASDAGIAIETGKTSLVQLDRDKIRFYFTASASAGGGVSFQEKFRVNDSGDLTIGGTGGLFMPEYAYHVGDTNTYFGFSGADTYVVAAGGTPTLQVTSNVVESSGIFAAGNGAVGAPSFAFANDLHTGMFRLANDRIGFTTGGSEVMRLDSNQNVIMGNTVVNPASGFDNQKGFGYEASTGHTQIATTANDTALTVGKNHSTDGDIITIRKESTVIGTLGSNTTGGQPLLDIGANGTNGNMRFLTAGSERMRIKSNGEINALGDVVLSSSTNSPMLKLQVDGVTSDYGLKNVGGEFRIIHTTTDTPLVKMDSSGRMGIDTGNASIDTNYSLQVHGAMKGASLVLSNDGSNGNQLQASGLGNSSNPIANFAVTNNTSGADTVHIKQANTIYGANAISFFYGTTESNGYIRVASNGTVTYEDNSDYRLKENIKDLTGSLGRISDLRPVTFSYKNRPTYTHEGFVAHEAMTAIPSAVTGVKDGVTPDGEPWYQGVDMKRMIPDLVGAIKELKAQNEDLLNRVKALESK